MDTKTNTAILEWRAPRRPDYVRSERWYLTVGSLCALLVVYGIVSGTWSMSIVFAFLPALYWLLRNESHRKHELGITQEGVVCDGKLSPWGDFKEFWILSGPDYHELHIAPQRSSRSEFVIQTGDVDPLLLRDILSQFLPQVGDRRERILDAIIRFCKL